MSKLTSLKWTPLPSLYFLVFSFPGHFLSFNLQTPEPSKIKCKHRLCTVFSFWVNDPFGRYGEGALCFWLTWTIADLADSLLTPAFAQLEASGTGVRHDVA